MAAYIKFDGIDGELNIASTRFHADQFDIVIVAERMENAHRVAAAPHTCHHAVWQTTVCQALPAPVDGDHAIAVGGQIGGGAAIFLLARVGAGRIFYRGLAGEGSGGDSRPRLIATASASELLQPGMAG